MISASLSRDHDVDLSVLTDKALSSEQTGDCHLLKFREEYQTKLWELLLQMFAQERECRLHVFDLVFRVVKAVRLAAFDKPFIFFVVFIKFFS